MQRTRIDGNRLHSTDRNRGSDLGEEAVLAAQVFAGARQPEIIEAHERPHHRDDAHDDQKCSEGRHGDRNALDRKRSIEEVSGERAEEQAVAELSGETAQQSRLPAEAGRRADQHHASVLQKSTQQQLSQI
jgi:hypothetical protein